MPLSSDSHIDGAKLVALGYVMGERRPEFVLESPLREVPPWSPLAREVRVVATEVFAGEMRKPAYLRVSCDAPFPGIYERAVFGITKDGWHWVFPADDAEPMLREILGGGS